MTREEADEWFENPPLDEISKEHRINATAMLSMMVGAMVLGRAVDDKTAELILNSVRKTVPRLKSSQESVGNAARQSAESPI